MDWHRRGSGSPVVSCMTTGSARYCCDNSLVAYGCWQTERKNIPWWIVEAVDKKTRKAELHSARSRRGVFYRKNCSGASFGGLKEVADFGSELNLAKTDGLSRKCFSSVWILVALAG
jgi:hypothetical protein